ncbi:MAG: hypothetical protein U0169_25935 [Polyangiaceae bacterium]
MEANGATGLAAFGEFGAVDSRRGKVLAVHGRENVGARQSGENRSRGRTVRHEFFPEGECGDHVLPECPRTGIVRLVFVEAHRPACEVEVRPCQSKGLPFPHALSVRERIEHAMHQRHLGGCEETGVLVGIEPRERLLGSETREEPSREGRGAEEATGIDGEGEDPVKALGDVSTGGSGERARETPEDVLCMVQGELRQRDGTDDGVHPLFESSRVLVARALRPNVIGVQTMELPGRPTLPERSDRGHGHRRNGRSSVRERASRDSVHGS